MNASGAELPEGDPEKLPSPLPESFAKRLRGLGPLGILAIVVVLAGNLLFTPLSAVLALIWAWCSRTPWRELGFQKPASWIRTLALGIVFGGVFKLVMKAIVMPLLGAPPINQPFHYLVGNTAALPGILYLVVIGAGFGEETIFRGYSFERLGKLFGESPWAKAVSVVITTVWFGWVHYPFQGLPGVQQAAIVGLVFGTIFAVTGRIWLLIIAHAAFDLIAVAIIYWDWETTIAQLVFR